MARMRLFVSGVKVPPRNTVQDSVLQQFMIKETSKNLKLNTILSHLAIAEAGRSGDKNSVSRLVNAWNEYVSTEIGIPYDPDKALAVDDVSSDKELEEKFREEYSRISHLRPKMSFDKKGYYVVTGLEGFEV